MVIKKIVVSVILFYSFASNSSLADTFQVGGQYESVNMGGVIHYPYHPDGLVTYDKSSKEWFIDGELAEKVGDEILIKSNMKKERNSVILNAVFGKLGFSSKGREGGRVQVVLDYTCPYSIKYYKELKASLSPQEFDRFEFLPISRNLDKTVMKNSLKVSCLPKERRMGYFESLMNINGGYSTVESCGNSQYLYGVINVIDALDIEKVPAVFIDGVYQERSDGSITSIGL